MNGPLAAIVLRDLRLALRVGGGAMVGIVFFLAVVTIVPFGMGPDMALLGRVGPAILWIGALLATLLGLDRLFQADADDGSLDLIMMASTPLSLVVAAKALAHWVATGVPLILAAPLLGLLVNVPPEGFGALMLTLAAGTPALSLIGTVGAALAVSLKRGGLLMAVLVLPLTIPVLIFGVAATQGALAGPAGFGEPFLVLLALTLVSLVVAPLAAAAALRLGLE